MSCQPPTFVPHFKCFQLSFWIFIFIPTRRAVWKIFIHVFHIKLKWKFYSNHISISLWIISIKHSFLCSSLLHCIVRSTLYIFWYGEGECHILSFPRDSIFASEIILGGNFISITPFAAATIASMFEQRTKLLHFVYFLLSYMAHLNALNIFMRSFLSMWNLLAFTSREFPFSEDFKVYFWDTLLCIRIREVFLVRKGSILVEAGLGWRWKLQCSLLFYEPILMLHFGEQFLRVLKSINQLLSAKCFLIISKQTLSDFVPLGD